MGQKRKNYTSEFKAKVSLEAVKGARTVSELASCFKIHPVQITQWKRQLLQAAPSVFERGQSKKTDDGERLTKSLYEQIGRLQVEVDFLRKKL